MSIAVPILIAAGIAVGIPVGHYYWLHIQNAYEAAAPVVSSAAARIVAWVKAKTGH